MKDITFFSSKSQELKSKINEIRLDKELTFDLSDNPEKQKLDNLEFQIRIMLSEFDNGQIFEKRLNSKLASFMDEFNANFKKEALLNFLDTFLDYLKEYRL